MSVFIQQESIPMSFTKEAWVILNPIEQSIRNKIEKYGVPLKDWNISINYGIKTGCNEAFIIDGAKRAELIAADPKSDEIIRPILRGRDIKRNGYEFADLWLINIECGYTNAHRGSTPPEEFIREKYPAIYQHFQDVASRPTRGKGLKGRDDMGDYWWELRSCAYTNDFSKPKICYSETNDATETKLALDNNGFYTDKTCFIMLGQTKEQTELLYYNLSSEVFTWYMRMLSPLLGNAGISLTKDSVELFPAIPERGMDYNLTEDEKSWITNSLKRF